MMSKKENRKTCTASLAKMDAISFYSFSIQLTVLIVSTEFDANLIAFVQTMIANSGYLITVSCTRCKSSLCRSLFFYIICSFPSFFSCWLNGGNKTNQVFLCLFTISLVCSGTHTHTHT